MFRYKLRTLLILMAVGPPFMGAVAWLLSADLPWFFMLCLLFDLPLMLLGLAWSHVDLLIQLTAAVVFSLVVAIAMRWLFRSRAATPS